MRVTDHRYEYYNMIFQKTLHFIGMDFVTVIGPGCKASSVLACFATQKYYLGRLTGCQQMQYISLGSRLALTAKHSFIIL